MVKAALPLSHHVLMARRYHFVINPKSGSSVDLSHVYALDEHLRSAGHEVHMALTRSLDHAGQLARQAVAADASAIVVAGGDGTVRAVIEATSGSDKPICVIPCGTENLLACEFGLDGSVRSCKAALAANSPRPLDVGVANGRYFTAIAGVGFDAEVIRRIQRLRRGHIGHTDYLWPICRTFWEYRFCALCVEADGQVVCDEPALVFVSNISRYAVGLGISPRADAGDGLLDLCVYKCRGRLELLWHSFQTAFRLSGRNHRAVRLRCRTVRVSSRQADLPVQLDGDPGGTLPVEIKIVPGAARILTPLAQDAGSHRRQLRFYHLRRWLYG